MLYVLKDHAIADHKGLLYNKSFWAVYIKRSCNGVSKRLAGHLAGHKILLQLWHNRIAAVTEEDRVSERKTFFFVKISQNDYFTSDLQMGRQMKQHL